MPRNVRLEETPDNVLQYMDSSVRFHREAEDGDVVPRDAYLALQPDLYHNYMSPSQRVALALNEVCCEQRMLGMVR